MKLSKGGFQLIVQDLIRRHVQILEVIQLAPIAEGLHEASSTSEGTILFFLHRWQLPEMDTTKALSIGNSLG